MVALLPHLPRQVRCKFHLSRLHEEFTKGRMPPGMFDDYVEWTSMSHAIRAYQEGEDFEYLADVDLNLSPEDYAKLTPKRLMLLDHLIESHASSINELLLNPVSSASGHGQVDA
ncbi:hypothetical protein KAV47_01025 [Candidatus Bathyarchaeota archaeon]|nr:hypothetical protein [Candidatus Bathyarchaeota archaeon]